MTKNTRQTVKKNAYIYTGILCTRTCAYIFLTSLNYSVRSTRLEEGQGSEPRTVNIYGHVLGEH